MQDPRTDRPTFSRDWDDESATPLLRDVAFNKHLINDGNHNSPFDRNRIDVGVDNILVKLTQGIDEEKLREVLGRAVLATTGIDLSAPVEELPWEEMLRGGLQQSLESQVIVFEVSGLDRTLTHQLVRTRKAAFLQQSQRATFMGEHPDLRIPESIWLNDRARRAWLHAAREAQTAYRIACEENISYQDARSILPESSQTYILCQYPIREFLATFAYRACSMFQWQHVHVMREMGRLLLEAHPFLTPYVKISCQTGEVCPLCDGSGKPDFNSEIDSALEVCPQCGGGGKLGTGRCTFQGWENVEGQCDFPWAKQANRVFLPDPKLRIGS